jgi:hypothetical protein
MASLLRVLLLFHIFESLYAAPTSSAAASSTDDSDVVAVTSVSGGSTYVETFTGTSLSQYSTATAQATITTTDSSGAVVVGLVLAGGLAWLGIPKAGAPQISPPTSAPKQTQTNTKTTTSTSTSTSTTSSALLPVDTAILAYVLPSDWNDAKGQKTFWPDVDHRTCGFPNDDPAVVQRSVADTSINSFCKDNDNKPVSQVGVSKIVSLGTGMSLNMTVAQENICSADSKQTIDGTACNQFLHEALDGCEALTHNPLKHGGTIIDRCSRYILHPIDNDGEQTCVGKGDGTGLDRDDAVANAQDFCTKFDGKISSPGAPNLFQYKQTKGDSTATLSVTYDGSKCTRGSNDGSAGYAIEKRACNRFFSHLIDWCNTDFQPPYGKYGGTLTDECGVYKLDVVKTEKITCGNNPYPHPENIASADGTNAVNQWCGEDNVLIPGTYTGFQQSPPKGESWDTWPRPDKNGNLGPNLVRSQAYFDNSTAPGAPPSTCSPEKKYSTKGDECKRKANAILSTCMYSFPDCGVSCNANCCAGNGQGGILKDDTANGCVTWSVFGQSNAAT